MDRRKNFQCCKCGRNNNRATRFVCLSCGEVFCKVCYNEPEEINNHKLNHPVQQVMSKNDLELFYGCSSKKSSPVLTKEQPITCPCCGEKGLSSSDLIGHMIQQHHSKNSYKVLCPLCLCGFEGNSKEPEFYGKNILQHLCIHHQLMPYYDDDDDDDGDDQNDDDDDEDDDDDDEYDEPHNVPTGIIESKHSTGQKRPLLDNPNEAVAEMGPAGDGYAVRKSITFLNIEGEPFALGEACEGAFAGGGASSEVGAGDSNPGLRGAGPDLTRDEREAQTSGNAIGTEESTSRTGLVRRNAMRILRGLGSRQRPNDPLAGGRSRVCLNNSDIWDVGAFISSHDQTSQRSKRSIHSRGSMSKVGSGVRGGGACSSSGRRSEMGNNLRHFDDLLDDCVASSFLRDSSIATELLSFMTTRRRQDANKNSNNAGTLSFEEHRMENEQIWKNFRKLDGNDVDKGKERSGRKQRSVSDGSDLWARAFDYDGMDYLGEHEAELDQYEDFYVGADGYELVDGEEDDDFDDDDDDDDDEEEANDDEAGDVDDGDGIEDEVEEDRFEASLKNMKEKNIIKFMLLGDKSKVHPSKQPERSAVVTLDKKPNKDREKFLLNDKFWSEYHAVPQCPLSDSSESLESVFVQELFLNAFNILSTAKDQETFRDSRAGGKLPEEADKENANSNFAKANSQPRRRGENPNKQNSPDVAHRTAYVNHENGGGNESFTAESKPIKSEGNETVIDMPHFGTDSSVPLDGHPMTNDPLPFESTMAFGEVCSAMAGLDFTADSGGDVVPQHQPTQNNFGARPKDRSYHNASQRNSLSGTSSSPRWNSRRSSSGFVSSSSKASSSSSSLLSSTHESNGRKKGGKNSSVVSSNSNVSDFSSPSLGFPVSGTSSDSWPPVDDGADGGPRFDGTVPSSRPRGKQPRSDGQPQTSKVSARNVGPHVAIGGPPKKTRTAPSSSNAPVLQHTTVGPRITPSLRGVTQQQQQKGNKPVMGGNFHPSLKSGKSSGGGSVSINNPNNNSSSSGAATVSTSASGSSNNNNNASVAQDNLRSNKPCNGTRNKGFLSQKDKSSFR